MRKEKNQVNSFLTLKTKWISGTNKNVVVDDREILQEKKVDFKLNKYYKSLFRKNTLKPLTEYASFLETLDLPKSPHDNIMLCEGNITEKTTFCLYDNHAEKQVSWK